METPFALRFQAMRQKLDRAAEKSGVSKADIVRMSVAHFLTAHKTPESLIAEQIRWRSVTAKGA